MGEEPGRQVVGYGQPPVEHRFRKGQSGNPKGRPKGTKAKPVNTGLGMRGAEEYLRLEAYRSITIREGEKVIELPAIQAVFRAMGVAALKGNRFVQKQLAEMVTRMEAQDHHSRMELFGKALDYKIAWDQEMERCRTLGLPAPQPIPHPDDMVLDPNTGAVAIEGPQTKEQKARFDGALRRRDEAQEEVTYFAQKHRRARDAKTKARWLEEWHFEQRMFDLINEAVPKRYRAELEHRSYAPGASRAGQALEELRGNPRLRDDYIG